MEFFSLVSLSLVSYHWFVMAISVAELKVGEAFVFQGDPFVVLSVRAKHLGRGGAIYRVRMKNLKSGVILEKAFRPTDKFEPVDLSLGVMTFMYRGGDEAFFMDPRTYDQVSLPVANLGSFADFLKEGEEYRLQFIDDQPVGMLLPAKIKRKVIEAPEAVAGNTATAATKRVVVEGNVEIETPLFVKTGDVIIISTETRSYISRAKEEGEER